jgi:hypothetical protein
VKALVLISPKWSYSGLSFQQPMRSRALKQNVAWLLFYGIQDSKEKADIERIEKQLQRAHPKAANAAAQASDTLQVVALPSKLQGGTLLSQSAQAMEQKIMDFLIAHAANQPHEWSARLARVPR